MDHESGVERKREVERERCGESRIIALKHVVPFKVNKASLKQQMRQ